MTVLAVQNLGIAFDSRQGVVQAVRGVDLAVSAGETLAIVGESGCGKSVTMRAVMGLLPAHARITGGSVQLLGEAVLEQSESERNRWRGSRVGMIFQDPLSAMNPTLRVGEQIAETLIVHRRLSHRAAWQRAVELLERVGVNEPALRARQYPNAFSGGMLQRAMIALALACDPALLIADEPTTALDVTVQAQVLALMLDLQRENGMTIVLITHDLGVVAGMADRLAVMYAGRVVETGPVASVFAQPAHPYTQALKQSLPGLHTHQKHLPSLPGQPPDLRLPLSACAFAPRCEQAMQACQTEAPPWLPVAGDASRFSRCWQHHPDCPSGEGNA